MKKLLSILLLLACHLAQSQTVPQGINYQAVALDQRGQPIPGIDIVGRPIDDAEIGVRITILENSPTGNMLYQEEHEVRTDLYGMFELVIGQGLQVSADPFSDINWQGDKFLQVELSIDNDGEFLLSAVQQLMTVPYAFLAENALVAQTAIDVNDADADPSNELQSLTVSGDSLTLSNGNTVQIPAIDDADADPNNEIQVLSISNDTLYLSNGGYAVLPADQINDADSDPSNEIQILSKSGSIISLTNGGNVTVFDGNYNNLSNTPTIPTKTSDLTNDSGFLTTEVDGSTTNELQVLSLSNDTIYLTSGGYVVLPAGFDGDYSSLTNTPSIPSKTSDLTNDSGFLSSEVDGSTSNELQLLSISNDTIYLTSGGYVVLPAGFDGDYSSLTNTPAIPSKTSDLTNDSGFLTTEVDGSTTNELQVLSLSNDTIYLTSGGYVVLPAGFDGDYSSLTSTPSIPSKTSDLTNDSGFITIEQDSSVTNELQTLSISNDTLFLSNGGFVKLPESSTTNSSTSIQNNFQGNYFQQHGLVSTDPLDTLDWIVPNGISQIQLIHFGSNGGSSGRYCASNNNCNSWTYAEGAGGEGLDVTFLIHVTPGDTVKVYNGINGAGSPNSTSLGNVGEDGGASWVFINNDLLIFSEGGKGGVRATCSPATQQPCSYGTTGAGGNIFLYGDSSNGISAGSINNSFNGGLNNYGLLEFQAGFNLTVRNIMGESSKTYIAY